MNVFPFRQGRKREVTGQGGYLLSNNEPRDESADTFANLRKPEGQPSGRKCWLEEAKKGRKTSTGSNSMQKPEAASTSSMLSRRNIEREKEVKASTVRRELEGGNELSVSLRLLMMVPGDASQEQGCNNNEGE